MGAKIIDRTGQRFGKLVVQKRLEKNQESGYLYECLCDCGTTAVVDSKNFVSGRTKSCGCLRTNRRNTGGNFIQLEGQTFGRLKVLKKLPRMSGVSHYYECACECGKITEVIRSNLVSGKTRSCGCLARNGKKRTVPPGKPYRNLVGERFSSLVVIALAEKRMGQHRYWTCMCDCGKETEAAGPLLIRGRRTSCGCMTPTSIKGNLTGRKFGMLTAIRRLERQSGRSYYWECLCDCGCTTEGLSHQLLNGNKNSCGCVRAKRSKNADKILGAP